MTDTRPKPTPPRPTPQEPTVNDTRRSYKVRRWEWDRGEPTAQHGIAVIRRGTGGLCFFLNTRAEAEELVEEIIELFEQPETWETNK